MQIETTATKESLEISLQKRKILRRPMIVCQTTEYGAGFLRMTIFVPCP